MLPIITKLSPPGFSQRDSRVKRFFLQKSQQSCHCQIVESSRPNPRIMGFPNLPKKRERKKTWVNDEKDKYILKMRWCRRCLWSSIFSHRHCQKIFAIKVFWIFKFAKFSGFHMSHHHNLSMRFHLPQGRFFLCIHSKYFYS